MDDSRLFALYLSARCLHFSTYRRLKKIDEIQGSFGSRVYMVSGKHLVIGQSGGATAVINASLVGAIRAAKEYAEIDGIYGARFGIQGVLDKQVLDLTTLTPEELEVLHSTPSAALGSCRYRLQEGEAKQAVANLDSLGAGYFVYIGGNDSADTGHQIAEAARDMGSGLRVIGVPKTIDNDLPDTDHCPGYGSAGRFLALAVRDSALCTEAMPSHYPVKIIEVMGRDAGWLAAATALGQSTPDDAPHLLYMPEHPFQEEEFLAAVDEVYQRLRFAVVVMAETVRDEAGNPLGAAHSQGTDAFGHRMLGGAAQYLVGLVREKLRMRARYDKPGDLQRMSSACVSTVDRAEAELVGEAAVAAAVSGQTDQMVTLVRREGVSYGCGTGLTRMEQVANRQRPLPAEFVTANRRGVTTAFRRYAVPLLGEPLPLPARLGGAPVTW
jgi:ATP-dependent phosphofructokinase / diphosphate-dependent phosphofructokinase